MSLASCSHIFGRRASAGARKLAGCPCILVIFDVGAGPRRGLRAACPVARPGHVRLFALEQSPQ